MSNYLPQIAEKTPYGYNYTNPFDTLYKDRIIFINDIIDYNVAGNVTSQLLALEQKDNKAGITLYLNSPGGSIDDVFMIADTINYISCPVHTACIGQTSGSASILLAIGQKRMMLEHARVILRQPSMGSQRAKSTDIKSYADELTRLRGKLEETLTAHSKLSLDEINTFTQHETVLTADKCLEHGLIDEILTKRAN